MTKLKVLATPHPQLYQWIAHFQALDHTIWHLEHLVQEEQEELHEVFSVLEVKGITEVLAPLIFCKRVEWYKPYQVYWQWQLSPTSIPLPDSPPVPSPIPSQPPTLSPKSPTPSPKSLSSYHTAPTLPSPPNPDKVHCKGCDKVRHLLLKCGHNYCYNPVLDTYTPIPYDEEARPCYPGWAPIEIPKSKKTGKSLA